MTVECISLDIDLTRNCTMGHVGWKGKCRSSWVQKSKGNATYWLLRRHGIMGGASHYKLEGCCRHCWNIKVERSWNSWCVRESVTNILNVEYVSIVTTRGMFNAEIDIFIANHVGVITCLSSSSIHCKKCPCPLNSWRRLHQLIRQRTHSRPRSTGWITWCQLNIGETSCSRSRHYIAMDCRDWSRRNVRALHRDGELIGVCGGCCTTCASPVGHSDQDVSSSDNILVNLNVWSGPC